MPRRPRTALIIALLVVAVLLLFPAFTRWLTDWWWFREVGFEPVFVRRLLSQLLLFLAGGVVSFLILSLNLKIAQRGLLANPTVFTLGEGIPTLNVNALLRRLTVPAVLLLSLLSAVAAAGSWEVVLSGLNSSAFGVADPIFNRDVGFYVFTLPAIALLLRFLTGLLVTALLVTVPVYWLRGALNLRGRRLAASGSAGLHLAILIAALFLLTAVRLWLVDSPQLLYSTTGPLLGASYTDLHARLPALRISAALALLGAGLVIAGALRKEPARFAVWAIAGYFVSVVLLRGAFPLVMQKLVVAPTELTRETPYLQHHIAATRRAWGLDSVDVRELAGEGSLTLADIRANAATIENVRLWDRDPLLKTFGQLQEIRTYYDFVSVDDDRYWIEGRYRQVLLAPRELNAASLPTRTFINEHLTFTHGMGLTLSPVNQVTPEGLPVLFVKDLPPASPVGLTVTRPQLYYGELANEFVFTGTRQREFDHPAGETNVSADYEGEGGVRVGNLFRRLVFAVRFKTSKVLFSQDITSASKVLYFRNIKARAEKALPFLTFDRDPYLVLAPDGTLQWILDAYTSTERYPYSMRLENQVNYLRNSVKVVIDAYHGTLTAYVSDPVDPVIQTWAKVFPGIFVPLDNMAAALRAHIRYPDDLFRTQTRLYTVYHMDSPEDFYHREDQWQIPTQSQPDGAVPFMRHIVMRLPGEAQAEFVYMVPFTPRGKDNLAAWMVARNDGASYGKLLVYRLSRQSLVFGPQQITNRINQDTEISRQVSLWDQRGSQVIRGDLLVIPIEQALLYVQPLYLQAEGGRIPELKRVIVAYQNQVVMEETLDAALAALFGGRATPPDSRIAAATPAPSAVDSVAGVAGEAAGLLAEARRRYQAALAAQREGDWARYGDEIRRLGEILDRLVRR